MAQAMLQMVALNEEDHGRVQALIVESVPFAQLDGAYQLYNLPGDCEALEAIWVEFPEDYKPAHAFGLCSAIENASLYINQRLVMQVSGFDLFAFGKKNPHANLLQLPLLPDGKLNIGDNADADTKRSIQLRLALSQPLGVQVSVSKRYYDQKTRMVDGLRVDSSLMYQFYNLAVNINEPGALIPIGAKSPTFQIAVALVDAGGKLHRASRVSLSVSGIDFDLKICDPLNPTPKGIYTYTFEAFVSIYGPIRSQQARTTLNLSRSDRNAIRITTGPLPPGCKAYVSTISKNVFKDFKPVF